MQVSVETTGALERRMTVAVPAEELEQAVVDRLRRLSRNVKMPGFRPGKVPLKMVEAQYGGRVLEEVAGELIQASFREAVGREGLRPAVGPVIEPKRLGRGQDLEYVATFEVYPEVEPRDLAGVTVERPRCQVEEADVDRTLERMRQQRVQWRPTDAPAAEGDRLVIDFEARRDGQPVEGGQGRDFELVVGRGSGLADLDRALEGARAGETREVDLTLPEDYPNRALAGQTLHFSVQVKEVGRPELPEIDAEFARQFGIQDGSLETLRREVRANLERELAERMRLVIRDRVLGALLEANPLEVPAGLVEQEAEQILKANRQALARAGVPEDRLPADRAPFREQARRRVTLGLLLGELARRWALKADPERVRAAVERMAEPYEDPQAFIQWHYGEPGRLAEVEAGVVEDMLVERLLESAQVVEKPVSFSEFMVSGQAADKQPAEDTAQT